MIRILPALDRLAHSAMKARGLETRFVEAGPVHIHVYEGRGHGDLPPTVLIHGLGASGVSYARVVSRLVPHVKRVLVPELPGHGRSVHPGDVSLTPDLLLDAMTTALESAVVEPSIVIGNSLGGAVALDFAVRHPDRVRGLVLVSPAGARLPEDEWKELAASFDLKDRTTARAFLDRIYHRPPWFIALVAHEFPDVMRRRAVRELLASATHEDSANIEDLGALRMPVLLLWGRSDRLLPATALAYFKQHLPAHTVVEEPEAFGHSPQLEDPVRFADRILRFAREVVG